VTPGPRDDVPARIVAAAAAWLPAHRRDWGRAMTAELAQVQALAGYLAFALTRSRGQARAVLWWALAAALASGAVWTVIDLTTPVMPVGITGYLWPVGTAAVLAASVGAAAATGSAPAGARAGTLTAVLVAPMHFAADLTALVKAGHYTLTTSYDVAAFPHSGYPDVASYLLSDAMAGDVLVGLVLYPLVLCLLALTAVTLLGGSVDPGDSVTSMLR
jgi:hypothetical protein